MEEQRRNRVTDLAEGGETGSLDGDGEAVVVRVPVGVERDGGRKLLLPLEVNDGGLRLLDGVVDGLEGVKGGGDEVDSVFEVVEGSDPLGRLRVE